MTQMITTADELAALPEGTVIRDCDGEVGVLTRDKVHYLDMIFMPRAIAADYLPATVLYRPDTETAETAPTPAETAEAIAQAIEKEAKHYVGEQAAYWAEVYAHIAREWAWGAS